MILECPGCHLRSDTGARPAGTRIRCRCGTFFQVPARSEVADALKCPQCGAVASPTDSSCRYCRVALALAACPRCFGRVFKGNPFCPHCGAATDVPGHATVDGASQRTCPRCQPGQIVQLTAHLVGDTLLDECHACGGLWIDAATFARIVTQREQLSSLLSAGEVAVTASALTAAKPPAVLYIPCPDCRALMNRQNFGRVSGVIIEICKPHGFWFDRDQFSAALRFVMSGGLEESKRRAIQDLNEELERKRGQQVSAFIPLAERPTLGMNFTAFGNTLLDALGHLLR